MNTPPECVRGRGEGGLIGSQESGNKLNDTTNMPHEHAMWKRDNCN